MLQSRQEVLVDRIAFAVDAGLLVHLDHEPAALLGRVGELAEGVGQLDAAGIELEPLGHARVGVLRAGQGGFRDRVFTQHRRAAFAQARLDLLDDDAAEDVGPAVVFGHADAGVAGGGGQGVAVGGAIGRDAGQQVDASVALERLGYRQPFGLRERITGHAPEVEAPRPRRLGRQGQQGRAVVHQGLVRRAGPVPLQHRELGMMQRPALAVAPHLGEAEDLLLARRQQLLAGELRRGVQVERRGLARDGQGLGGEGVQVRLVAGRDLQGGGLDLLEPLTLEPGAERLGDPVAGQQERAAVGVDVAAPPGGGGLGQE